MTMRVRRIPSTALAAVISLLALACKAQELPEARVVVRVVDELGRPFAKAQVVASFEQPYQPDGAPKFDVKRQQTDSNGLAVLTGKTRGHIAWGVESSGYYTSYARPIDFFRREGGHWLPWNQTNTTVVKQIKNPIPMYAKLCQLGLPEFDKEIGFDFTAGDWVEPHGKGQHLDIFFRGELEKKAPDDFRMRLIISFPNRGDGLQPFDAPPAD